MMAASNFHPCLKILSIVGLTLFILQDVKAQEFCVNSTSTFERTVGVAIPSTLFLPTDYETFPVDFNDTLLFECNFLCKFTPNCGGYYIDHAAQICHMLTDNLSDQRLTLQPHTGSFFERICLEAPQCRNLWIFDRVVGMELNIEADRTFQNMSSKLECQQACLSEKEFQCRSVKYDYERKSCHLNRADRRSRPDSFVAATKNVDYFENQCASDSLKCAFSRKPQTSMPYIMARMQLNDSSVEECQQKCESAEDFVCRSVTFDRRTASCSLSSDDQWSVRPSDFSIFQGIDYYERSDCMQVTMKCDSTTMTAILSVSHPFRGKVYAMINPDECSSPSTLEANQVALTMPLTSSLCGTRHLGNGTYTNSIIVQHHPSILRSTDKRIDVMCEYEQHRIRLKAGKQIVEPEIANITSVVTGIAPTPDVRLRIVDATGADVTGVDLGSDVYLRVELMDERIYGIMGTSLIARSGDGFENITLIDEIGCPIETSVFPPLELTTGSKTLEAPFQAFRFASDSTVRFQITISFCLNECNPVHCDSAELGRATSFGRRRRSASDSSDKASGLQRGDIVSDVVMEGALMVRAKLERNEIQQTNGIRKPTQTTVPAKRAKVCTSSVVVMGVGIMAAVVQLAIIGACVFIVCGRQIKGIASVIEEEDYDAHGMPSLVSTSSKLGLCDNYAMSSSTHSSIIGYVR